MGADGSRPQRAFPQKGNSVQLLVKVTHRWFPCPRTASQPDFRTFVRNLHTQDAPFLLRFLLRSPRWGQTSRAHQCTKMHPSLRFLLRSPRGDQTCRAHLIPGERLKRHAAAIAATALWNSRKRILLQVDASRGFVGTDARKAER